MTEVHSIRNLCFVGHPSSGKTTLVDALAHLTGASARKGSVDDGTSICDTEPEEQEKRHTLQMSVVHAEHGGKHWTFMDTPGYPDFVAETDAAIFASDLVVGVVSCASGVTYNLRKKMERARHLGRPRAIVVTNLDGENADFDTLVEELRAAIGEVCVPALLPDGSGAAFSSVHRTMLDPESPWRKRLMDRVMDACEDEEALMAYLDTQEITEEQLDRLMPHAITAGALIPILVCNPESGLANENVLEYFTRFAPAPDEYEIKDTDGQVIERDENGLLEATVFCVKTDPHVGKVCFARIWSGTLHQGDTIHGETDAKPEKLGGLFRPIGTKREPIESAGPGMIVAFTKVEHLKWGESFSTAGGEIRKVAPPETPTAMLSVAITPKTRADEQKLGEALHKLEAEDPTFHIHTDSATHELVGHGMSDLHLSIIESRLKRRYGVEIEMATPKIAFRETITKPSEGHHRHKKQSGGRGQFGEVYLRLRPGESGSGIVFVDKVVGGAIPRNLIPAVEKGIREIAGKGVLTSSVVVDVEAEVYDGKFHAVDSDEASFKMAAQRAFRDGFEKAGPALLEPVYELEIHVPTDVSGTVFSDITSQRRGHVMDQWNEADGTITVIKAEVPLSTVQTYHRELNSQTSGQGFYSMVFKTYAPVPAQEQARILKENAAKHDDD